MRKNFKFRPCQSEWGWACTSCPPAKYATEYTQKICIFLLENSKNLLETFACGADRRRRCKKLGIPACKACKATENLTFQRRKN